MKNVKFITYTVFIMLLTIAISSCKGDDGPAGADGVDGADGANGADGAANVTSVELMATDITWTVGTYIGVPSNVFTLTVAELNQDIIDHGMVLGFSHLVGGGYNVWGPMPFDYDGGAGTLYIAYTYVLNELTLYAYSSAGTVWDPNPIFPEYRFLLIPDNTIGKTASKESILEELKNAGIDANDYYDVRDYYGINP